jgi:hypothetical protein
MAKSQGIKKLETVMKLKKTVLAGLAAIVSASALIGSNVATAQSKWPDNKPISLIVVNILRKNKC